MDFGGLVKIVFAGLTDEIEAWPPVDSETLWAEPLGNSLCRLDNIPFFARGVAFNDIVKVDNVNGELIFRSVDRHCGHSTYRLLYEKEGLPAVDDAIAQIRASGCSTEGSKKWQMVAIDIPPTVVVDQIYAMMEEFEQRQILGFEEGFYFDPRAKAKEAASDGG